MLKDWKRIKVGWKKMDGSTKAVRIIPVRLPDKKMRYLVEVGKWSSYGKMVNRKVSNNIFKKSEALNFAKAYMRKN